MPWGPAISAAGSIVGGLISSSGASSAADAQAAASNHAADLAQQRYDTTRADLLPYNQAGQANLNDYANWFKITAEQAGNAFNLAQDHIPQAMTEANLIQTPGYQFNLNQGIRATQNSAAARGLGVSGAAMQGAAKYATGLADSTYQNQFANQQTIYNDYNNQATTKLNQLNAIYNQLGGPVQLGENAAAQTGNTGATLAEVQGNALQNAGRAQAAGIQSAANTWGNTFNQLGAQGSDAFQSSSANPYIDSASWDIAGG